MSTHNVNPQQQNIQELLEMIREVGGTAVAFSADDAAAFATRLATLLDVLATATHTIIIGVIPHSPTREV